MASKPVTAKKMTGRHLFVFDFDETIVNCNSDTWIYSMAPGGEIPKQLKKTFGVDDVNWISFMAKVFQYLHQNGVTKKMYTDCLKTMPFVPGVKELLYTLSLATLDGSDELKYEIIIISDANSFAIDTFLEHHGLRSAIAKVFTNGGWFDDDGLLHIEEYHHQDWCTLSAVNLCKGHVLEHYVKERAEDGIEFTKICYSGDGQNDLCPSLRLSRSSDITFPREGYPFHRIMVKEPKTASQMVATVSPWSTGLDILNVIGEKSLLKVQDMNSPVASSLPTPPPSPPEDQ
ncbi:Pyridoxal phosphate phosphatase PHOSPHO2 [Halotydeus destructor]|nr:Pyridoxal phosphate phosphatase PHOSPHO2 [Halotydeus destructor]